MTRGSKPLQKANQISKCQSKYNMDSSDEENEFKEAVLQSRQELELKEFELLRAEKNFELVQKNFELLRAEKDFEVRQAKIKMERATLKAERCSRKRSSRGKAKRAKIAPEAAAKPAPRKPAPAVVPAPQEAPVQMDEKEEEEEEEKVRANYYELDICEVGQTELNASVTDARGYFRAGMTTGKVQTVANFHIYQFEDMAGGIQEALRSFTNSFKIQVYLGLLCVRFETGAYIWKCRREEGSRLFRDGHIHIKQLLTRKDW